MNADSLTYYALNINIDVKKQFIENEIISKTCWLHHFLLKITMKAKAFLELIFNNFFIVLNNWYYCKIYSKKIYDNQMKVWRKIQKMQNHWFLDKIDTWLKNSCCLLLERASYIFNSKLKFDAGPSHYNFLEERLFWKMYFPIIFFQDTPVSKRPKPFRAHSG